MGFLFMKCPTVLLGVVFIYNGAVAFKLIIFFRVPKRCQC